MTIEDDAKLRSALKQISKPEPTSDFYKRFQVALEEEPDPKSSRHRVTRRTMISLATSSAAAIVVAALVVNSLTSTPDQDPGVARPGTTAPPGTSTTEGPVEEFKPTLASQVLARAGAEFAKISSLSGTSTITNHCDSSDSASDCISIANPAKSVVRWKLTDKADSFVSVKTTSLTGNTIEDYTAAYDSSTNRLSGLSHATSTGQPTAGHTDDAGPQTDLYRTMFGHFTLTSLLDGLSMDDNASLERTDVNGRDAYSIHARGLPTDEFGITPNEVYAVFDEETLLPVSIKEVRFGRPLTDIVVSDLLVNPTMTQADFNVVIPNGSHVENGNNGGWRQFPDLASASKAISYQPLQPAFVPDGFVLTNIFVTKDAGCSGGECSNPKNLEVVNMTYRRGMQSLEFTTRLSAGATTQWVDPLGYEGSNATSVDHEVKGGVYNGLQAHIANGFGITPHIWIKGSTLVTTISGDVSNDELVQILESVTRL